MSGYIELDRRFRELTKAELAESETWTADHFLISDRMGTESGIGWRELLEHRRVVLLADAGAGKSTEMKERARLLSREDRYAFFVPLESLDREPITDLLSKAEEQRFERWKADGEATAWFLLDSVDELKLTAGKLERALRRFSREIQENRHRVRVIVSCRPSDWRPVLDLATMQEELGVDARLGGTTTGSDEDIFLAALKQQPAATGHFDSGKQQEPDSASVRTVAMLPMSDRQIERFARRHGIADASTFLEEVDRQNAWDFARRPLDLVDLVANWSSSGDLGTRAEQHEANVAAKLKEDPGRPDSDTLTDSEARQGAELLALALALTRKRAIRSPEQAIDADREEGVLRAETVLPDWTEAKRQALLRRALFDPATYGRVKFHTRTVEEYLAACCLRSLREKGMSASALFSLLFAVRYGLEVVFPSMRPMAAWMALRDGQVRQELVKREPEVLLSFGDPGSLEIELRASLLRAFVHRYGHEGRHGLDIPIEGVRRLAHPKLGEIVRECWEAGAANEDVRELLLKMIWQGPIESCADLAEAVALDASCDRYSRIMAIRALLACGRNEVVRKCADDMLARPASWPDQVVCSVAKEMFPRVISAGELVEMMEERPQPEWTSWGFRWVSQLIAESVKPWSIPAIELRNGIADLIWRRRGPEPEHCLVRGEYNYLAPALGVLCERQLSESGKHPDADLIRACVIARGFGRREISADKAIGPLREHFVEDPVLRSMVFWAELAFLDEIVPIDDDWRRLYRATHDGLLGSLTETDRTWLERGLADSRHPERRPVALHALIGLWCGRGSIHAELGAIRRLVQDDHELVRMLADQTAPRRDEDSLKRMEEFERETRLRRKAESDEERKRLEDWRQWREELLEDPDTAFSGSRLTATLSTVYAWLRENSKDGNRRNAWNKEALAGAFGVDVAHRIELALRALWRANRPTLWSKQSPSKRNRVSGEWALGLMGVSAEAETPGWSHSLSGDEALIAAAYATVEWNGFAPFISDLAKSHPDEVEDVIGGEVSAELEIGGDLDHLSTLSNLAHAGNELKTLFVRRLLRELRSWPNAFTAETGPRWASHLESVLRVLGEAEVEDDRAAIAEECVKRYQADPAGLLALTWLRGLFESDPARGSEVFIGSLADSGVPEASTRAIETLGALFGGNRDVTLEIPDPAQRARVLGQLVRCAYAFIRLADDTTHNGPFTPDARDNAQTARNFLLSRLLHTPGPEAYRTVVDLAEEDDFAPFSDRLRLLSRQEVAEETEFKPLDTTDVVALGRNLEAPAKDRDGLFSVLMDRLEELDHDLRHHELSDRKTVQRIDREAEMQRTLAWRLETRANGVYRIAREEEVADGKKTDIRLLAANGGPKAVIEVKIADNWSLNDLQRALRDQLVGQYLRHTDCRCGCLLLTHHGRKKLAWQHPGTREPLTFHDVVGLLQEKAKQIEVESSYELRVTVFGIDLAAPANTSMDVVD